MGSEFGTFVGFGWILSSVLVDKPGFQKGLKQFEVRYFWVRPNTIVDLKKQMVISMPECHSRLYLVDEIVFLLCLDN